MPAPSLRGTIRQLFIKDVLQYVREPTAAFFTFVFPAILFSILGTVYGSVEITGADLDGSLAGASLQYIDVFFPGFVGFIIANICLMSVPNFLAYQREAGYFRAMQVSPVSLVTLVLVRIGVYGCAFVFSYLFMYAMARVLFGVQFLGHPGLYAAAVAVSFAALGGAGFLLGGMLRSPQNTQALASIIFFVLYFSSGSAIPRQDFPSWLYRITEFNPLTHVTEMLAHIWLGLPLEHWWLSGLVVAGTGLACLVLIPFTFKWSTMR